MNRNPSLPEQTDSQALSGRRSLHSLVVGGTGMLAGVVLHLAELGHTVSVVARRTTGLKTLINAAAGRPGPINPIALDYRDTANLQTELSAAQKENGAISLAVCWIHSTAPVAHYAVARAIRPGTLPCRYFRVRGSAAADPSVRDLPIEGWFLAHPALEYREVILGFILTGGSSRWLTDEDISRGVIDAIKKDAPRSIVGTVHPWSMRP